MLQRSEETAENLRLCLVTLMIVMMLPEDMQGLPGVTVGAEEHAGHHTNA